MFGYNETNVSSFNLTNLNGSNGFALLGYISSPVGTNVEAGSAINYAGDVNADGVDDLIISTPGSNIESFYSSSFTIFGQSSNAVD
ncbi:MAG: hypothetical protein RLN62_07080 [Rickettsiales bacterium]